MSRSRDEQYLGDIRRFPVYGATVTLSNRMEVHMSKVPVWLKMSRCNKLKNMVMDILLYIYHARTLGHIKENCIEGIRMIDAMKFELRVIKDAGYLTPTGFGMIANQAEEVRRQLKNWAISQGAVPEEFPQAFNLYKKDENVRIFD